jgi:hypothetical protein
LRTTTTRTISVASVAASVPTMTTMMRTVAGQSTKITAIASGIALKTRTMTKRLTLTLPS